MDNQEIKTAYDDYTNATVALFVEYYSEACAERIHEEMSVCSEENVAFPTALDKRCRELIKKENTLRRRKQMWKTAKRITRSAAIIVLVMLALASVLFATVEAVRIPIINYFIERTEEYWKIISPNANNDDSIIDRIDATDPLAGLIPDGYIIGFAEGQSVEELTALYENAEGKSIFFSARPYSGSFLIDVEDAQVSQACTISGHDAMLIIKNTTIHIVWISKNNETLFTFVADELEQLDAMRIVEKLIEKMT